MRVKGLKMVRGHGPVFFVKQVVEIDEHRWRILSVGQRQMTLVRIRTGIIGEEEPYSPIIGAAIRLNGIVFHVSGFHKKQGTMSLHLDKAFRIDINGRMYALNGEKYPARNVRKPSQPKL